VIDFLALLEPKLWSKNAHFLVIFSGIAGDFPN